MSVPESSALQADPKSGAADASRSDTPRWKTAAIVSPRTAVLLLAVVVVVWGANWPIIKLALEDVSPLTFVSMRFVLGLATVLAITAARGQLHLPSRGDLPIVASTSVLQIAVGTILINLALGVVPPGRSAVLFYTMPLWVTPGAVLLLHERLTRMRIIGLIAGLAGIAVLFNPAQFDWTDGRVILGNALLICASISWAVQMLHVRSHRWRASPLELLPWQLLIAAAISITLALALESGNPIDWNPRFVVLLVFNGPIVTALCFWAYITVNRALKATTMSLATLAVPVVGVISSILVTGETLTASMLAGLGLIGAGLVAVAISGASAAAEARRDGLGGTTVPVD